MSGPEAPVVSVPPAARLASLVRLPLQYAGFWLIAAFVLLVVADLLPGVRIPGPLRLWTVLPGVALLVVSQMLTFLSPVVRGAPLVVASPVRGRWQAVNSPATKVPSHGSHAYGQTYAIDLVHVPDGVEKPEFGKTDAQFLPNERFPGFGAPIHAVADGVVVAAHDRQRDHRSRSGWLALLWFATVESVARSLGAPSRVVGNNVRIRVADGTVFIYAHLHRGSQRVSAGDRVVAGQHIADCGDSGNSTEPHLHIQRQDRASLLTATGLPWAVRGAGPDGEDGLPADEAILEPAPSQG